MSREQISRLHIIKKKMETWKEIRQIQELAGHSVTTADKILEDLRFERVRLIYGH